MGVYFHFKTVDLSPFTFDNFISTTQYILDKVPCDQIFPLRTMVACISCFTSISRVAKPARHLVMQMHIFLCFWPYKERLSKEMNNGNDLNLHSMTKLSGWLRYCSCSVYMLYIRKVLGFILSDDYFEIKSIIHSFNCLSYFYSYLELQDDFIFQNLFLFIFS